MPRRYCLILVTSFIISSLFFVVGCRSSHKPEKRVDDKGQQIREEACIALKETFSKRLRETEDSSDLYKKWSPYIKEFLAIDSKFTADKWVRKYHQDIVHYYSDKFVNHWRYLVYKEDLGQKGRDAEPLMYSQIQQQLVDFALSYSKKLRGEVEDLQKANTP